LRFSANDMNVDQRGYKNLPFDEWTESFGSERLAGVLLDRITYHVHTLEINGGSYRLNKIKMKLRAAQRPSLRITDKIRNLPW
jgi:hypothetical protein